MEKMLENNTEGKNFISKMYITADNFQRNLLPVWK